MYFGGPIVTANVGRTGEKRYTIIITGPDQKQFNSLLDNLTIISDGFQMAEDLN